MPRMVEQKIRSAVPLYLAAGAFLAASALLPIYQWWAIVLAGVLAAGVYWVADKKIPPRTVLVEQPYQTGSQDLDELLAQAQTRLDQLHTLNERIPDAALSAAILRMENAGAAILEKLSAEPEKARSARRFRSSLDGPRSNFRFARRQEGDQIQQMVGSLHQLVQS